MLPIPPIDAPCAGVLSQGPETARMQPCPCYSSLAANAVLPPIHNGGFAPDITTGSTPEQLRLDPQPYIIAFEPFTLSPHAHSSLLLTVPFCARIHSQAPVPSLEEVGPLHPGKSQASR
jgi:hypothetical protein